MLIAQLDAATKAQRARQPRPAFRPGIDGLQAGVLGGTSSTVTSRPATAADLVAGRGIIGGSPTLLGNNPNTLPTLNRYAPGLAGQLLGSRNRGVEIWVAPPCVRGQYCW